MDIRIYLTGRVGLEFKSELVIDERDFRGGQARLAFAYLVLKRERTVPREELAAAVWPGEMPPAWETALSALVSRTRKLLARTSLSPLVATVRSSFGQHQLRLPADTWVDVEAAAEAIDAAEGALRSGTPKRAFGPATVAATITRRPFLSGANGGWVEAQRRTLQRQLQRALECQANIWLSTGESHLAVEVANEAVTLDSCRESSYQLLMRAHSATGNRAEAVRVYHRLRELLTDELGTDPSKATETLYLELLN